MNAPQQLIQSFATGNTSVAERVLAEDYIQHNLAYGTGRAAFIAAIHGLASAPVKTTVENIRVLTDGEFVALHTIYDFAGSGPLVAFDLFRLENGKIAEHWDNLAPVAKPNPSGHTQVDGPVEIEASQDSKVNKALVTQFVHDVLMGENAGALMEYFDGDKYIQHNSEIADGVSGLLAALEAMGKAGITMKYDRLHKVLGEGNFVLAISEGTFGGAHTAFYDLWRIENGKIAEHWDVVAPVPPAAEWANQNGKF